MQSAEEDRLLEVSFVSRVREEARVIELYDESDHVALGPGRDCSDGSAAQLVCAMRGPHRGRLDRA